jgi:cyclic pyranopterin phosphate synthase
LGRSLTDLRISVTDRCNFRCTFCMPEDREYEFVPRAEVLCYEEILRLARIFVSRGVHKIRVTGGEPLLRRDLERLIEGLASLEGLDDFALTTNGLLLPKKAESLRRAGLQRVTVSLHSLEAETFSRLTGGRGDLAGVLAGIDAAAAAGLTPVKINAVVIHGVNDHEIVALARRFRGEEFVLRFIEYMDVGTLNAWDPASVVSAEEIIRRIDAELPLEPAPRRHANDVAQRYRYRDGGGEVGVIASITEPFCGDCTRARLSADGHLYTCLFSAIGHDLKAPLRAGASDAELGERLDTIWGRRSDRYSEERSARLLRVAASGDSAGDSAEDSAQAEDALAAEARVEMFRIGG